MYDELVKRLHRYSENCVAYKLDADFADAVQQAANAIEELTAELEYTKRQYDFAVEDLEKIGWGEWIPVTNRLPKGGDDSGQLCENVLLQMSVEYDDNYVTSGWINGVTKKVYYLDEKDDFIHKADMSVVKAWMPLPEPPKGE